MHILVFLVVALEDTGAFTWQHFFGNVGQHFESFSQTKPRSCTKPLATFEILTILSNSVEMGPSTWEAEGWDSQRDHMNLAPSWQQAETTALHLNWKRGQWISRSWEQGTGMNWQELPGCSLDISTWRSQGLLELYSEELEKSPHQLT